MKFGKKLPAITAATATAAITAAITEATRPPFLRPSLVYREITTVEIRAVQGLDRSLRFFGVSHFDEAKTAGSAGKLVRDHPGRLDGPVRREQLFELFVGGRIRQPTNVYFTAHALSLSRIFYGLFPENLITAGSRTWKASHALVGLSAWHRIAR
jgi:hypothetical protein